MCSVAIEEIDENVLLLNIKNTDPDNYGDKSLRYVLLPYEKSIEQQIKGAAQCCWLLNEDRVKQCEYVLAVNNGKIRGVYNLVGDKCIPVKNVALRNVPFINYPPYRLVEIHAHMHSNYSDILSMNYSDFKINKKEFNYALEDIPLKEENDLAKWDKRKFLILENCSDNISQKFKNKTLLKNGEKFRFHGAVEYFFKEKAT